MRYHIIQDTGPISFPVPYKIFNNNTERHSAKFLMLPALLVIFILLALGCSKSSDPTPAPKTNLATVATFDVLAISQTTGLCGGHIIDDGGAAITARGICWSITANPTINNFKTILSTDHGGIFGSFATGLEPATTYYIRAYATNSAGTAYGDEVHFTTLAVSATSVTDIDGNLYHVSTIGSQTWMLENLKTTNYQNGDEISIGLNDAAWGTTTSGACSIYNNDQDNNTVYGKLYNWYAGVDPRKIAPPGWHVPSRQEWETLISFLGGSSAAGGEMKETGFAHWTTPNTGATNSSGFTGLPTGSRLNTGAFTFIGSGGLLVDDY